MFPSNISNRTIDLTSWMYVANSDTPTANDESLSPTVSALNANHFPTPSQEELISVLVTAYSTSQNLEERESICCKLKELRDDLIQQRENIFEFVNEGTDDVFGILQAGKTVYDRDDYIRNLMTFHVIGEKIKQVRGECGLEKCRVDELLNPHHSMHISGDLKALKILVEGHTNSAGCSDASILVPDLSYNKGEFQFG
ncbi:TPA: NleF caspase inhibitor [Providencia alcalifaciens]|uniref:NleF caspase inhibitor n=1 Tax=Providencia alcalifaciens TaxID=126385 RepID=UPI0003E2748C|nr:NleF caspase inhibitor [Providencia alcalifaciens]ETT01789.1 hypothetical protein HMPREF1568_2843 [Providencia alcalifaciens PAL-3]ETT05831.1 hypothetical protein HMPREF1562_1931 [Providencia alcalifaciens F90-2004]EUC97164.1 hypothetical protein HMPREF1567_2225 [Providencia alcalifaciens PAL-2]EUD00452.1 hypothetical protein HMPREF1566_1675 [Providencia alcalifaciens PAL-1]MTB33303.1 type III effector [Providencia alcalifaciens]